MSNDDEWSSAPVLHAMVGAALTYVATYVVHKACKRFYVEGKDPPIYTKPWVVAIAVAILVYIASSQLPEYETQEVADARYMRELQRSRQRQQQRRYGYGQGY